MIITIDRPPSSASVVAAFFDFGFLNAGTPLLIASTPVRAAQPDANARRIRKNPARPVRPWSNAASGASSKPELSAIARLPVSSWIEPTTAIAPMASMNR